MSLKAVFTTAILIALLFVTLQRAEPNAEDSPPTMIRRPSREGSLSPRYVPSQIRSARIHGNWQLHPAVQQPAEADKRELEIRSDGTAKYTGLIPFVIEEKNTDDSEGIPGIGSTRVEMKQSTIRGQWDLNDQYFSIVTSEPSIHRFHVLAITADTLVVESEPGYGPPGKIFWVRSSSEP